MLMIARLIVFPESWRFRGDLKKMLGAIVGDHQN